MKKTVVCCIIACLMAANYGFAQKNQNTQKNLKLKSSIDSVSYLIGVMTGNQFAESIRQSPMKDFNFSLNAAGYKAALEGGAKLLSDEEAQTYLQNYFTNLSQKEYQDNKLAGEKFLAENSKNADVKSTPSGLQYKVIRAGNGAKPVATDKVKVHYKGTTLDGKTFDSSYERNSPAAFALNQVIPGWTEGVQLMPVGSKYTFWIPSELAYGERGAGNNIKPGETLVFEVELLEIEKKEEPVAVVEPDTTYRVVGDYERIEPKDTKVELESVHVAYSLKEYTVALLDDEMKILDKDRKEIYAVTDTVHAIEGLALYVPLRENQPYIVITTRFNENGLLNLHDVYLIDAKKNSVIYAGRMNISLSSNVTMDDTEEVLSTMKIYTQKSDIRFTFGVPYITYFEGADKHIQLPASDFYYTYNKRQGLQPKGEATGLSFFKKKK